MRQPLALFIVALLTGALYACGATNKGAYSASHVSSTVVDALTVSPNATSDLNYARADRDRDNDIGAPNDDTNNDEILKFAHPAGASDKQSITALIKHYYAALAASDGVTACSMLFSTFAEAVPEDFGQSPPGPSYLRGGKTCQAVIMLLHKHFQSQLAVELPLLKVTHVRLDRHHGLAVLSFGTMPERQLLVAREGHTWKLQVLIDSELP
jgi:hypothetical protein